MKKLLLIAILLSAFICNICVAQNGPVIKWQKCIGGSGEDKANDVLIDPDGSFIVAGYSKSNNGNITDHHGSTSTADALVAKLDANGNIVWIKSIGGDNDDYFTTVIATNDNAYLCIGYTNSTNGDISNNHGGVDILVVKLSAAGDILWSKCYGGTKTDFASDAVLIPGGSYAVIGTSYSYDGDVLSGAFGRTDPDGWVFKLNAAGTLLWEKCLNNFNSDIGTNITLSEDNNLYALVPYSFYHINQQTGNSTQVTSINSDSCVAMCRKGDTTYASFITLSYFPPPGDCYNENLILASRGDGSTGFINKALPNFMSCDLPNTYNRIARVHGLAPDDTSIIAAGRRFHGFAGTPDQIDSGEAFVITKIFHYPPPPQGALGATTKTYGGSGTEAFTSIKSFPAGNDYVAAGYTSSNDGDVSGNHGYFDCWVVRLEGLNKITGNVFLDANNNGIKDAGELPFNSDIVNTTKTNFHLSALPYNGVYLNSVDTGTFTTTLALNRPYYSFTPANKISTFTTYRNTDVADFAVHAIPGIQDYNLSVTTLTQARPGFNLQYQVSYNNAGTLALTNKNVTFIKDSRTTLLGSVPGYTSISGDTIRWHIASLPPITSGSIILNLVAGIPPMLNSGDVLISNALIDSTGDNTPVDNYMQVNQTVTGSYDPNDKQENFGGTIYPPDIAAGKYLNYTIRFQNTGNDTAFTIILRDTLDNKLLADSIEVVAASHPYQVNIKNKKYLTVTFNDIKLVDYIHNEPLSHGYFSYRIKPRSTLIIGDTIKNTASIYFDFNLPVKTNRQITIVKPTPTTNLWTGAVSTAWEDPNNWGNHLVPDENANVIINTGLPRYPVISSNAVCKTISVNTGTNVLVKSGFTLKVMH